MKISNSRKNIESGLKSLYPVPLQGNALRRFNTMVSMITALIESQHVSSGRIADHQPGLIQAGSQIKKNDRWLENKWIDSQTFYLPFVRPLLLALASQFKELVFVIDGSVTGRNCQSLMVSVLWKGKALPLLWKTSQGPKGHFPQADHLALLSQLADLIAPLPTRRCVMLGDGEYDGSEWIKALQTHGFEYVLRTARDTRLSSQDGESFQGKDLSVGKESHLFIADCQLSSGVWTHFLVWHERGFQAPVYLLTNQEVGLQAASYYRKRFRIETLFKDFKSQGFELGQCKLSDASKIERLLIVCSLAYLWLVGLGSILSQKRAWLKRVYKVQKETFNLFTIGKRLYKYLTKNGLIVPNILQHFLKIKVSV